MVAPQNGCYTFDEDGKVKLEFSETPAASENPHDGGPTIRETQQDFANDGKLFIMFIILLYYYIIIFFISVLNVLYCLFYKMIQMPVQIQFMYWSQIRMI